MSKQFFSVIAILSLFSPIVQAQWIQKADFPGGGRLGTIGFTINNTIFALGGLRETSTGYAGFKDLWQYDDQANTWTNKGSYPGGNIYGGISFVIDSLVFVGLGGNQSGTLSKQLWAYNINTKTWKKKVNFPGEGRVYPFTFTLNKKGYVGAGVTFQSAEPVYLNDFWQYDPTSDSWAQKGEYPGGGRVGIVSFSINDVGYAGLGDDGNFFSGDFYSYDPDGESWTPKAQFHGQIKSFPSTVVAQNIGYIIGGEKSHLTFTTEMAKYDPVKDEWGIVEKFTGTPRRYGLLYFVNNSFYYGLGQVGPGDDNVANDFWQLPTNLDIHFLEASFKENIYLWPNPVSLSCKIAFSNIGTGQSLRMINCLGEVVYTTSLRDRVIQLDVSQWPKGTYYYQVSGNSLSPITGSLLIK